MSTPRARANHGLYLARILLDAWHQGESAGVVAAQALNQAYLPGVREHLINAYGWFLLQLLAQEGWEGSPPRSCAELPPVAEGKALPGEIREFQTLEQRGWLRELLAELPAAGNDVPSRTAAGLTLAPAAQCGRQEAVVWASELEALFDRMSNSLDEC